MRKKYDTSKIWAKNHRVNENGVIERLCSGCNEWIEENTDNFYLKNKAHPAKGFQGECKKCTMRRSTKWIKTHPEKYKEIMQKTDAKDYRVKNRREWSRQSRENGQRKEWELNNPDKLTEYTAYRHLHKMHDITEEQWLKCKEYFDNSCAYCGLHIDDHFQKYAGELKHYDFHKEHIDDNGSNGLENCVPSCNACNSSKRTNDFKVWYSPNSTRRGGEVYSEERYNKIVQWTTEDYKEYI